MYTIKEIKVAKNIVVGATCDNCKKKVEPVLINQDGNVSAFKDMAEIRLDGHNFGEYFDGKEAIIKVFCGECLDKLLVAFPSLLPK